jgi:hypothetical protein
VEYSSGLRGVESTGRVALRRRASSRRDAMMVKGKTRVPLYSCLLITCAKTKLNLTLHFSRKAVVHVPTCVEATSGYRVFGYNFFYCSPGGRQIFCLFLNIPRTGNKCDAQFVAAKEKPPSKTPFSPRILKLTLLLRPMWHVIITT